MKKKIPSIHAKVELPAGEVSVRVKLSNFDNLQWRLWAFALRLEPAAVNH